MTRETCVMIHGFTGLPSELEPLSEALQSSGYAVVAPTLAGHDGTFTSLRGVTATDWIESAACHVEERLSLGPVHIIGFSMGALIAAILASKHPVTSVTMLAPAIHYARPQLLLRQAEVFVKGRLQKDSEEAAYLLNRPSGFLLTPPSSVEQFRNIVKLAKQVLPCVEAPACVIQGDRDEIVDPASCDYVHEHIGSTYKELHHLPHSRHHVCLDVESMTVIDLVSRFLTHAHAHTQT